ncbi:MAG: TetR-like C-terminal domain-containing protein [Oenococcus sp.]|uniref:TetR/AcrR family transcriptional regulator n=1 Tax=Oenococcus TaxID=46254 RepID=UPI0021E89849|nr:TetR-like C-terminal domain-containing protein [Oenococcus kitaharae]MCV3296776.1 TetR family transcriptional regulator C-terminal domain-containing protein [Oenococcus kitaharae]
MVNVQNNKKRRASVLKIEKALVALLQEHDLNQISIIDICHESHLNRSTFYANFLDIYDLVDKLQSHMLADFKGLYQEESQDQHNSNDFTKLFRHIQQNQLFYTTYFKLKLDTIVNISDYDTHLAQKLFNNQDLDYHKEFFRAGITAIIKKWLDHNCDLSPEEMSDILATEYQNKI